MTIDDLGWMQGGWECSIWGGKFEEHWLAPRSGAMVGVGRHLKAEDTAFMEFMSIETNDDGITMWMLLGRPSKGDKKGVPFKMTSLKGKVAVFENPANDFPSKMTYSLRANGQLFCHIEGEEKGKKMSEDFDFKRLGH